jgi:phenylacetate-coenzyme A ligase PaaK-like adenylate-forming protein
MGTLHEDRYTCSYLVQFILECEIFRKNFLEKIKTNIICATTFFFSKNVPFYQIKWKNMVKPDRPQTTTEYGAYALHAG